MQVLIPPLALTAKKYGVDRSITEEALYGPRLNIQLGPRTLRDHIDKLAHRVRGGGLQRWATACRAVEALARRH